MNKIESYFANGFKGMLKESPKEGLNLLEGPDKEISEEVNSIISQSQGEVVVDEYVDNVSEEEEGDESYMASSKLNNFKVSEEKKMKHFVNRKVLVVSSGNELKFADGVETTTLGKIYGTKNLHAMFREGLIEVKGIKIYKKYGKIFNCNNHFNCGRLFSEFKHGGMVIDKFDRKIFCSITCYTIFRKNDALTYE